MGVGLGVTVSRCSEEGEGVRQVEGVVELMGPSIGVVLKTQCPR